MADNRAIDILLIEDNPNDLELTLHALRKHHLANSIQVARDGAQALDYLFCTGAYAGRDISDTSKVILLDYNLPKISGLEVLRRIKADPRTRSVPVVVLTASTQERDRIESYHLGADSFIVKPVDFQQFTQVVERLGLYWLLVNQSPEPTSE